LLPLILRHVLCVFWSRAVDQRELPAKFVVCDFTNMLDVAKAIKDMLVRGAPAIGAAAGFGMVLAANAADVATVADLHSTLVGVKATLDASRPTAVNLMWATARLLDLSAELSNHAGMTVQAARAKLLEEAIQLCEDDVALNKRIGLFGASVVPDGANILHHCNTGTLATVQYGTAIGVIYSCHALGKNIHVWVDETRPRLQGAKLTAWELMEAGVPMHLIPDNAVGLLMYQKKGMC
jgi:methylthioribose-1-phosphate isomerase